MNRFLSILPILLLCHGSLLQAQTAQRDSLERELGQRSGQARVRVLTSLTETLQRNEPKQAIRYANEALSILETDPDPTLEADVRYYKGWAHYYDHVYDSVETQWRRLIQISRNTGRSEHWARALLLKARLLRQEGKYERGIACLDSALVMNRETSNTLHPLLLNELGSIYRRQGDNVNALDQHMKALAIMRQLNDKPGLATTLGYIGIAHDVMGNYDEALRFHQESLALREELGDPRGAAASLTNIGILFQKIRRYDESLEYLNRSLAVWNSLGLQNEIASVLNNIGAVLELQVKYEEAMAHYGQAFEIWNEVGNRYSVSIALSNMGGIRLQMEQYEEALTLLNRALDNRLQLGDRYGSAGTLLDISETYLKLGKPDSALQIAQRSLSLAEETGSWSLISTAHETLSSLYEGRGNYQMALDHYRSYKAAQDTIFNAESHATISELQEQYRTRQQQQQIELLQHNQEIQTLWMGILIGGFLLVVVILALLYNRYNLKKRAHEALEQLHQTEIEKAKLRTEAAEAMSNYLQAENERQTQELETARNLQLSLLPSEIPDHPAATISAFMQTAVEVGGDYYDFNMEEDGTLTIAIGDATGHGTKAGTLVTATKSLFNLLACKKDLITILRECSKAIRKMNLSKLYMALALVRLRGNEMDVVGAGMPPALLYHAGTGVIEPIPLKGMPMGSATEYPYRQTTVTLQKGDLLLLMSDGLPELPNETGERFGYDRVPNILAEYAGESPGEILKQYREQAQSWLNGSLQQDDITFVALKMNSS